jgi:hypothetical protein
MITIIEKVIYRGLKLLLDVISEPLHMCDSTASEIRSLSPKIILGDSRRSENA